MEHGFGLLVPGDYSRDELRSASYGIEASVSRGYDRSVEGIHEGGRYRPGVYRALFSGRRRYHTGTRRAIAVIHYAEGISKEPSNNVKNLD